MQKLLLFICLLGGCSGVTQARTIALVAYGSLINEPERGGHRLKVRDNFKDADITLPISMRRHSGMGTTNERITAVIDKSEGKPKAVFFATMDFSKLKDARENLSLREGSAGKLTYVHYIKKDLPDLESESPIEGAPNWYIRKPQGIGDYLQDVQLSNEQAKKLAEWASSKGYDSVIWASYPPNIASEQAVAEKLVNAGADSNLFKNTVGYINQLPKQAETKFEKAVVIGIEALKEAYGIIK